MSSMIDFALFYYFKFSSVYTVVWMRLAYRISMVDNWIKIYIWREMVTLKFVQWLKFANINSKLRDCLYVRLYTEGGGGEWREGERE